MSDIAQPTKDPVDLLAYYDSRKVQDATLMQIFSCSAEDLDATRKSDEYINLAANYTDAQIEQATGIDDKWNEIEAQALTGLSDVISATADPRVLLAAAREANKASRRNGTTQPSPSASDIVVPQNGAGETRVVRLRAKFVDVLQDPDGTRHIAQREIDIRAGATEDLNETMTPVQVKKILTDNVGVDTAQMHVRKHQGPDVIDGSFIDFDKLGEV